MNFLDEKLPQRFWDKVTPEPMSGCWLWVAGIRNESGYGNFRLPGGKKSELAHRYAYQQLVGPIDESLSLDIKCGPLCVNPQHMEPVTRAEAARRAARRMRDDNWRPRASLIAFPKTPIATHHTCGRPYDRRNGKSQRCSHCQKERMRAYTEDNKTELNAKKRVTYNRMRALLHELKSVPCADCGGTFDPVCMDFDHRDSASKVARVSDLIHNGEAAIMAEVAKCDVVCSNCHRLRTYRQRDHRALVSASVRQRRADAVCTVGCGAEGAPTS